MRQFLTVLLLAVTITANAQLKGFNWGQMFSFVNEQYGSLDSLPSEVVDLIKVNVPYDYYQNARFSGTMSNYMNLHELGFGSHIEQFSQWQILTNRLPAKERNEISEAVAKTALKQMPLIGLFVKGANTPEQNMDLLLSKTTQFTPTSFLVNFVNAVRQLSVKNVEFTFNSHMPYRGLHTLDQSLASLSYVYANTNLTHIELENETYLADYICGTANSNEKKSAQSIQPFYDYLERFVVPAIYQIIPKTIPVGLSITDHSNQKRRAYNAIVKETADRLIKQGYSVYLAPHFYFSNTDEKTIRKEIKDVIDIFGNGYKYRATEFNLNSDKFKRKLSQIETIEFIERVRKIASEFKIEAIYYHTIYTQQGAHYSFVK